MHCDKVSVGGELAGVLSGACGGAPLHQEGVAHVAHPHRPRVGRQGQLIAGTAAAVDVSTVSAVMLQHQKHTAH